MADAPPAPPRRFASAVFGSVAGRSRRTRPALGSGRQIRRHRGSDGNQRGSSTTPGLELQQVARADAEPRRAPPPEKSTPTPNHPPPAPPPPGRRRQELHPTLPYRMYKPEPGIPHPPAAEAAGGGEESHGAAASPRWIGDGRPKIANRFSRTVTGRMDCKVIGLTRVHVPVWTSTCC